MNRYKPFEKMFIQNHNKYVAIKMVDDDQGEWVRYDDVEKEKFAGIANAIIIIAADLEKKRLKVGVCNCEKRAYDQLRDTWVCPAHGYKKL